MYILTLFFVNILKIFTFDKNLNLWLRTSIIIEDSKNTLMMRN